MDASALSRLDAHVAAGLPHARSLLIARNGRLVFERYCHGAAREDLHNVQSMTRSLVSALLGIALREGHVKDLDGRAIEYLADRKESIADPRVERITLRQLLTMTAGFDEMGLSFDKQFSDPLRAILGQKPAYPEHESLVEDFIIPSVVSR